MAHITKRPMDPEILDRPDVDPAELHRVFGFVQWVNRRLGGTAAVMKHIQRWSNAWPNDQTIRILDIATGAADIPIAIGNWAKRAGHRVHITGIDLHPVTVRMAKRNVGHRDDITILQADALKLGEQFPADSFEYVHAGLFLHHLHDVDVLTVLAIMDRLATRGVIWNDLVRSPFTRAAVRVLTIGTPGVVRHDSIVSIANAFTHREAMDVVGRAGWTRPTYRMHLLHRFTVVSTKA